MKSSRSRIFNQVPIKSPSRNLFDLSHEVKMSGKFGILYPMLLQECLPGDTMRDQMTCFLRAAPMLAPIMHRVDVKTHFFFVPYRILSDVWEDFITGGQDGADVKVLPYITPFSVAAQTDGDDAMKVGTLWDYLGLPCQIGAAPATYIDEQISALPFRAYAKVWNDFYRDPNLDDELELNEDTQGNVSVATFSGGLMNLRAVGWEKDYFTAALPWAQRGAEVLMPLAGTGVINWSDNVGTAGWETYAGAPAAPGAVAINVTSNMVDSGAAGIHPGPDAATVSLDASEVSINDFRRALAIQRWLENNARGGGRYIEQIQSHFNVRVPDYRLQRAEYLGGGSQHLQISEVLSTADTDDVPVGDMAGHGISVGKSNRFTYRCQEHGVILGVLSIKPKTAYSQGIDRMWSRTSKYDFAFPELANIGEQEILSKEVFFSFLEADQAANDGTFGYIPRFAEYKFRNDRIAGDFRTTLGFWHLGRNFTERPALDSIFTTMYENGPAEETYRRIFAVQDGTDYFWMQLFHRFTAKRPLPYFGVPKIM